MKTVDEEVWHSEVAFSVKNMQQLKNRLKLKKEEKITDVVSNLPLKITPYYLELIKKIPVLRRTMIPTIHEYDILEEEDEDPLAEDRYKKTDCIIHKYPDRVLFLCTTFCASYCRYCTRSRVVGNVENYNKEKWNDAFEYIKNHPEIHDVILSGGDPLTLNDNSLEYLLKNLKGIPHVDIIRIGTKVPVVLPSRINDNLIKLLKKYKLIYINIHFTHKSEITEECKKAINGLLESGAILGSQTVLLKGINDDATTLKELFHELLKIGVKPYYLFQMDKIKGGSHFRCDLDTMIDIMKKLISYNGGMSIPEFIVDTEIGKIPLRLDYVKRNENGKYTLTSFEKNQSIVY